MKLYKQDIHKVEATSWDPRSYNMYFQSINKKNIYLHIHMEASS